MPNWRDESAYPSPSQTLWYWRWDFTRRRPDYRKAWQQEGTIEYGGEVDVEKLVEKFLNPNLQDSKDKQRKRLVERFGYPDLEDPKNEQRKMFPGPDVRALEPEDDKKPIIELAHLRASSARAGEHLVRVTFDIDRPLSVQIEAATGFLKSYQEDLHGKVLQRRLHREKWPLYLRIIDARDAGETWETIGRELLGLDPDSASEELPVDEFDRKIDHSGSTAGAKSRQVWEQARDLMFNFPN